MKKREKYKVVNNLNSESDKNMIAKILGKEFLIFLNKNIRAYKDSNNSKNERE